MYEVWEGGSAELTQPHRASALYPTAIPTWQQISMQSDNLVGLHTSPPPPTPPPPPPPILPLPQLLLDNVLDNLELVLSLWKCRESGKEVVLQSSWDMPQSEIFQKARGATRPGVSLPVALLQILQQGHVRTVLQHHHLAQGLWICTS